MGGSEKHLRKVCPSATVERGLSINGNQTAASHDKVAAWAKRKA